MRKFKYQVVSMAVILRDIVKPKYINEEHKDLVDIADMFYNANLGPEYLKDEYKGLYERYGKEFFDLVLKDASAIDSQLTGSGTHEEELALDYGDYISGAIDPYETKKVSSDFTAIRRSIEEHPNLTDAEKDLLVEIIRKEK